MCNTGFSGTSNATTAVRSFVLDLIADDPEILSFSDMWWEKSPSAITEALARRLVQAHFVLVTNEANEGVHFVQSSLLRQRGTASSQQQMQSSLLNATGASQISSEQALLSSEPASSAGQTPCASAVTVSQGAAKKDCLCKHCTGENLVSISGVSDCGPPTSTRFSPSQGSARYLTTVLDRTDPQHATGSAQVQLMTSVCRCSGHVCIALPQISGSYTDSSKNILHVVESVHIAIEAEAMPESRSAENVPLALFLSQQDQPDMPDARPILRRAPHTEVRRDRTFRDWICSFRPVVEASPARDHGEVGEFNLGEKQHNVTKLAGPYDMPALTKFCRGSGSLSESFGTKFDMERDTYMHVTSGQKGLHSISFSGEPNNPVLLKAVLPDCQALALRVKGSMHVWSLPSTSNLCDAVQKTRCRIHEVMLDNSNMCIHIPAC